MPGSVFGFIQEISSNEIFASNVHPSHHLHACTVRQRLCRTNRAITGSGVVVYGNRFAFQQEAEYANRHTDLPVRLFISVGGAEELAFPVEEFMQVLRERNYQGLLLETLTVEGEGHASNKPESYNRGLRFLFQK